MVYFLLSFTRSSAASSFAFTHLGHHQRLDHSSLGTDTTIIITAEVLEGVVEEGVDQVSAVEVQEDRLRLIRNIKHSTSPLNLRHMLVVLAPGSGRV